MTSLSNNCNADGSELSRGIWLLLPLALSIFVVVAYLGLKHTTYVYWFERELGFIEIATPALLIVAIIYGVRMLQLFQYLPTAWLKMWMLLVTLSCVYFAGEELSWGQHLLGWETPEEIKNINDQDETNVHNMSSWFDQKPRMLLELWVIIGGIFIAGLRKWNKVIFNTGSWKFWFWPGFACFPAAVLAELAKLPKRIKNFLEIQPGFPEIRYNELQELMFAAFLLCYLASNYKRLKMLGNK